MKKKFIISLCIAVLLSAIIFGSFKIVNAQESTYTLSKTVIGSGGMGGSSGTFSVQSTLGQPLNGTSSTDAYTALSGFWNRIEVTFEKFINFLPMILR